MQWLSAQVRRLAVFMVLLGSIGMLASMAICVADVIGTNVFDWPVPGTLEFTESTMVLIVFGALAYTQEQRGHIRVELLNGLFGPRVQSCLEMLTHFVALVFFGCSRGRASASSPTAGRSARPPWARSAFRSTRRACC